MLLPNDDRLAPDESPGHLGSTLAAGACSAWSGSSSPQSSLLAAPRRPPGPASALRWFRATWA